MFEEEVRGSSPAAAAAVVELEACVVRGRAPVEKCHFLACAAASLP